MTISWTQHTAFQTSVIRQQLIKGKADLALELAPQESPNSAQGYVRQLLIYVMISTIVSTSHKVKYTIYIR